MITRGEYVTLEGRYGVILDHRKDKTELLLVVNNSVYSAYKKEGLSQYSYANKEAKKLFDIINKALGGCNNKNKTAVPFEKGVAARHFFKKSTAEYIVDKYDNCLVGLDIKSDTWAMFMTYMGDVNIIPEGIQYVKLSESVTEEFKGAGSVEEQEVVVRNIEEILLDKEVGYLDWIKQKKYYVINDEDQAETILNALEQFNGPVAYDVETTGLKMNMFGKIGSKEKKFIEEYNANAEPKDRVRVDKLVGLIFSVEPNVSYYFACGHRKFKNLYENPYEGTAKLVADRIKSNYVIGEHRDRMDDMAVYIRETPINEWGCDVILMERIRKILETKPIIAHNGSFEWKSSWIYNIDINLKDDTMILHQLMYKFRSTTSNRGEPSNLKHLTHLEFGANTLELKDFFPDFKEDKKGEVRSRDDKAKSTAIDFSYMTYEGTYYYAPADGDFTLQLFFKYKKDLLINHAELEYLYNVEVLTACAIGYTEFYGHRIDEEKIQQIRDNNKRRLIMLEHKIRVSAALSTPEEDAIFAELAEVTDKIAKVDDILNGKMSDAARVDVKKQRAGLVETSHKVEQACRETIDKSPNQINLGSPAQVAQLFFDRLKIPFTGDKISVGKKILKPYTKLKNEDGTDKYPAVVLYTEWKKIDTLLTKFFDNLQYFMYPGGFIFSGYGQIAAATGRMNCSKPNAQQYPKDVTGIVVPRKDCITMDADFSQIEYRTLVAMAQEYALMEKFYDPDVDYHTMMAALMYSVAYALVDPKMRGDAKSFNFGIPYGMGFASLAILLRGEATKTNIEEAKQKYELYFKDQPNVKRFFEVVKEQAQVNKYTKTYWGRTRYYSFVNKDGTFNSGKRAAALRQAGNAVIQGCLGENTRIQTKELGIVKIKDAVNMHLQVWDGDKWSNGDITYSGKKQKCVVTFSNGQSMICSPIHKFLVVSRRGQKRFVECKDLLSKEKTGNAHRVVINQKYEQSDRKYSSKDAYKYKTNNHMSRNVFLEDIKDSFDIGVVLGRLASDGSILQREVGGSSILQYVAEHEESVMTELKRCMEPLGYSENPNKLREGRNELVNRLYVYSKSLVSEVSDLEIKYRIHDKIFQDTELLRGFLRGIFDGDGGISGKCITLVFGDQEVFGPMCLEIQKALLFFGIRSRYRRYEGDRHIITIKTNDNRKFLDTIGFINEAKQNKGYELQCETDEHIFGPSLVVESVEITEDFIDMYDVCNTDGGYYVADGVITHNTAADIFKIAIARVFSYIRAYKLYGLLFLINFVHDEILYEVNTVQLNGQRVLRDVAEAMQLKVDGFPPLFIGAGFGKNWAYAKGKNAEIHPHLAETLSREADNMPIFTGGQGMDPDQFFDYIQGRVDAFRVQKIADYILNPANQGDALHPAIGSLVNLLYEKAAAKKGFKDAELTEEGLRMFIEEHQLEQYGVSEKMFRANQEVKEVEEDDGYEDDEDEDDIEEAGGLHSGSFALIDEDSDLYSVDIRDIIRLYGLIVSKTRKLCGIDATLIPSKMKDELAEFVSENVCEPDEEGAVQIVLLRENNLLFRTDVWVKNVDGDTMAIRLGINNIKCA